MIAKYSTRCHICPVRIRPGEQIAALGESGSGQWVHAQCHPDTRRKPTSGATEQHGDAPLPAGVTEVHTDGACLTNPDGPGGWAWVLDQDRHASGSDPVTTNQRMEIRAALEAVRALTGPLVVVSDSRYVVDCFNKGWWRGWRKNGWTNAAKKPVANRDLWEPLVDLVDERDEIAFRWVKGHAGHAMNELADQLAGAAARRIQAESTR